MKRSLDLCLHGRIKYQVSITGKINLVSYSFSIIGDDSYNRRSCKVMSEIGGGNCVILDDLFLMRRIGEVG